MKRWYSCRHIREYYRSQFVTKEEAVELKKKNIDIVEMTGELVDFWANAQILYKVRMPISYNQLDPIDAEKEKAIDKHMDKEKILKLCKRCKKERPKICLDQGECFRKYLHRGKHSSKSDLIGK